MRNTGTIYNSADHTPVVLPEMAELLPPLTGEQLATLETDLLKNGCYSPIIVNEDMVIIDGHNRQRLCEQHGLPYQMAVFSFEDLLEAKQWALDTQKGRRNLDKWELGKIALRLKPDIEARAKENMSAGGGDQRSDDARSGFANSQNPVSAVNTTKELADAVGIGQQTMSRVRTLGSSAEMRGCFRLSTPSPTGAAAGSVPMPNARNFATSTTTTRTCGTGCWNCRRSPER